MKVEVDPDICIGSGNCAATCPKVFELRDNVAQVKVETVPPEEEESAREAVDGCPVSAISVAEE